MKEAFIFGLAAGAIILLGLVGCAEEATPEGEDESPYSYWCWWAKAAIDLHEIDRAFLRSAQRDTADLDETVRDIEQRYHQDCSEGYVVHWEANIRGLCARAREWRQEALYLYQGDMSCIKYSIWEKYNQWVDAYCLTPGTGK